MPSTSKIIKRGLLLITGFCLVGCNFNRNKAVNNAQTSTGKPSPAVTNRSSSANEDFEPFFKKFKSDPAFQKSRIVFPLKVITPSTANNAGSLRLIPKHAWQFISMQNPHSNKQLIRKASVNPTKFKVEFLVEDTGIDTDFQFENKNGQWSLVLVRDLSD